MDPQACHGCEFNPDNGEKRQKEAELLEAWEVEILQTEMLYDICKLGLITLKEMKMEELQKVRLFQWELERRKAKQGI